MAVNFNPNINFGSVNDVKKEQEQQKTFVNNDIKPDTFEKQSKPVENKEKVSGFRNGISKIAKFFASLSEMTKATFKGLFYGALATGTTIAGFWAFGSLPRAFKTGTVDALKSISKKGKIFSAIAGISVLTGHIIKGKLNANKRTANIDHELKTGHDEGKF